MMDSHPAATPGSHRALWISLGLFGLISLGVLLLVFLASKPRPLVSSPDQPRPWAQSDFDDTLIPGRHQAIPDLSALPVPTISLDSPVVDGKLPGPDYKSKITLQYPPLVDVSRYHEVFPADASGVATLPDGTRLTLTAIAMSLPSDADPDGGPYQKPLLEWQDPATGTLLPEEKIADSARPEFIPSNRPRLFIRFDKQGDAPFCWHGSSAYDPRTFLQVSQSTSGFARGRHGTFWIDLDTWHQTSLKLTVEFAFGQPVEETLALEKGATATIGNLSSISALETLPFSHGATYYEHGPSRPGMETLRITYDAYTSPPPNRSTRTHILLLWPPVNQYLMRGQLPSDDSPRTLHGDFGVTDLWVSRENDNASLALHRYPRLGRAVFSLDTLPRLPEVENLFEVPMERVTFDRSYSFPRVALDAAGVRAELTNDTSSIPETMFPLVLEETTPADILAEYEKLTGTKLYFDPKELVVTDERNSGFFTSLRDWWNANKPSWLP